MKYLFVLLLTTSLFFGCKAPSKPQKVKESYYFSLYFRYLEGSYESKIEFIPTKGSTLTDAKPVSFNSGVFFNGGLMTYIKSNKKYTLTHWDEFPPKLEVKIDSILHFKTETPIYKDFAAKIEGDYLIVNARTPVKQDENLIVLLIDTNGKTITFKAQGPITYPYRFSLKNERLAPPIRVATTFQRSIIHEEKNVKMAILIEYYPSEFEL